MTRAVARVVVDPAEAEAWLRPRSDVVLEREVSARTVQLEHVPRAAGVQPEVQVVLAAQRRRLRVQSVELARDPRSVDHGRRA